MLELVKFTLEFYKEYSSWFDMDKNLKKYLGGIDDEWMQFVLDDQTGDEWALLQDNQLVGVAGVVLPTLIAPSYVISNLCIRPGLRRKNLGQQLVTLVINKYNSTFCTKWQVFVDNDNLIAQNFFASMKWMTQNKIIDEMISFEFNEDVNFSD